MAKSGLVPVEHHYDHNMEIIVENKDEPQNFQFEEIIGEEIDDIKTTRRKIKIKHTHRDQHQKWRTKWFGGIPGTGRGLTNRIGKKHSNKLRIRKIKNYHLKNWAKKTSKKRKLLRETK